MTSGTATSTSLGGEVTDSATSDFDPAGAGNAAPVGFSVNLAACTTALGSGYSFSSGNTYYVSVIADGRRPAKVAPRPPGSASTWLFRKDLGRGKTTESLRETSPASAGTVRPVESENRCRGVAPANLEGGVLASRV